MGRHGTIRRSDESEQGTTGHAGRRRAPRGPATIGAGADAARPGGVARRRLSHHRLLALLVARALHTLSTRGPGTRGRAHGPCKNVRVHPGSSGHAGAERFHASRSRTPRPTRARPSTGSARVGPQAFEVVCENRRRPGAVAQWSEQGTHNRVALSAVPGGVSPGRRPAAVHESLAVTTLVLSRSLETRRARSVLR